MTPALRQLSSGNKDATAVALAALSSSLHIVRILANRGQISPNEVETIYSSIVEITDRLCSEKMQAIVGAHLGGPMSQIRETARRGWQGPDPEPRHE